MSENTVKARLRHAVKPEATWTSDNPVLKEGEVGYVKETGRYKVGDGKTAWNSLAWAQPSSHTHDDRYIKLTGGTMTGALVIQGNASNKPLKVKGIVGSNGSSEDGELYLQYGVNQAVKLGSSGSYNISADGGTYSGKAAQATKLATARTINGTSFDGSGNITTANWGTSRNITIGNTKKAVNGGGDISWSLAEIGCPTNKTISDYIASRGENLVTNGTCLLGNNTNFSSFTYDGSETYYAGGSFKTSTLNGVFTNDEYIPVDVNQTYKFSYYIKSSNDSARYFDYVSMYDIDKNNIQASNVMWIEGSTTTLAKELKKGDTKVYLTSVAGFNTSTTYNYQRGLIFWNYQNSKGYSYGKETYSRNTWSDLWTDGASIDKTNNTITLKTAWTHGTFPAGTFVSQRSDGGSYTYLNQNFLLSPANTWIYKTGVLNGTGKNNALRKFREGTAFVKVGWLVNRNVSAPTTCWISTVSFTQNSNVITSAGSVTQPVYFSNGKPVACNYNIKFYSGSLATGGWKELGGTTIGSKISIAYNNNRADWNASKYSSSFMFGTEDTRGLLDLASSTPVVSFGGSTISKSTDDDPQWYFKLSGTNGKTYTLPSESTTLAALTHTHTKSQITDFPTSLKNPTNLILRLNGGTTEGTNQFTYDGSTAKTISITPSGIGAAASGHNHDNVYLGKTATATAATKLATKREVFAHYDSDFVMNFSYDGSANSITTLLGYYSAGSNVQGANNYPYHRFAKLDKITSNYADRTSTFLITQDYDGGGWGIVRLSLRTNGAGTDSTVNVQWLCRVNLPADFIQVGIYNVSGSTYADAFIRHTGTYSSTIIRNLASGSRGNILRTWILVTSMEDGHSTATDKKNSAEAYATIAAAGTELHKQAYSKIVSGEDAGTVSYANTSGSSTKATQDSVGQQINTTYIKSLSISGKTITYTKGDNTTGTITTQDTDTHYTTGLKVCSSASGTANAAATNGNVRINILDNTTVRDSHLVKGAGATTVTSDASGVITINSTNTTYSTGTTSTAGLTKLYTSTGTSVDGTMTRKAITDALSGKAPSNHNHDGDYVPLENGTVTVSSDMGAYIDLQDTNGGLGTHLQMSVKGASKWDLAANSSGELSLTYITSAGSNWLYAMNASRINMYQSVTVGPSPLATTANSMMVKVTTAGLQNFAGRTISLYASGSDNNYAGIYDHDNGWILYCDTDKVVHIPKELSTTSVTVSGNLQWRNSSGTAYVIAGTLSNDSYKNMTRIGNLTYETGIYTKTNVWKNGSTTTHFATTTTTSDQRLKEKISDMSVYEDFFCKLKPFAFKYHEGLYNANGTKPMIQWGYGAQDTVKAFKESGLDWQQEELVVIEDGELTEEEKKYTTDGKMFKMNYQNMSALNTHMIQKCLEEIAELKRQLVELKEG